ncbi:VUT family protein [Paenibacillus terreus]|uniref:VUT family protein n=1 Tax=Paenibacillus terreus TaxID=1387834 RepID=A0ABV5BBX5_9BACL
MRIFLYIASIVIANVVTASFAPLVFGNFIVPMGTVFIGATFIFRDLVQQHYGRLNAYKVIAVALLISALTSWLLGDTLWIVFASAITFIFSETFDTEVFTRLKGSFQKKVLVSGTVGGIIDSGLFVIIGLSPLGANFLPWALVSYAILGQAVVKTVMQLLGFLVLKSLRCV